MKPSTASAFTDDVLARHDGVAIARLIRDREVSVAEVIAAAIERANQVDPLLGAIVTDCFDAARQRARKPLDGPFAGVPMLIKDLTDVAGMPTKYGTAALENSLPVHRTHPIAQQLLDMGMVCLGKSTMPEFGFTASTEFPDRPPTRNPWNLEHTPGGSSGGSAALVAAGVVPIAHGSDGGGSIRIPASCCGLVGLKPTRGRLLPSQGREPFVGIVTDGVLTRSVRDTAMFMAEAERLSPRRGFMPIGHVLRPLDRSLRIAAVAGDLVDRSVDPVVKREFAATLKLLESLGHRVTPVELPNTEQFAEDFRNFWCLLAWTAMSTSRRLIDSSFDRSRVTGFVKELAGQMPRCLHKLPGAVMRLRKSSQRSGRLYSQYDVLVGPTMGERPPLIGHLAMELPMEVLLQRMRKLACFTPLANATGVPAISLPLGFDIEKNLSIGMMFSANLQQERLLLELALQLEAAQPFRLLG
ncbi:amidase [Allorhodopirellula heiligendammensis]|uniref:6-aminohexanoate-cyclic-dimer hydrolase n=1 Tax=Allorhodopirellula heiligendammensis TaxID=2714739 RepID=A0A5C6C2I4_9BACT|nr:amidase [Allorhodopirellula heiligendammensis]TWU17049.1 6-aminohexanoate-cyclic-dimer hydrolase [Allorhodopirellula heiligendammensis]